MPIEIYISKFPKFYLIEFNEEPESNNMLSSCNKTDEDIIEFLCEIKILFNGDVTVHESTYYDSQIPFDSEERIKFTLENYITLLKNKFLMDEKDD